MVWLGERCTAVLVSDGSAGSALVRAETVVHTPMGQLAGGVHTASSQQYVGGRMHPSRLAVCSLPEGRGARGEEGDSKSPSGLYYRFHWRPDTPGRRSSAKLAHPITLASLLPRPFSYIGTRVTITSSEHRRAPTDAPQAQARC